MKTKAALHVFAPDPAAEIVDWQAAGKLTLHRRPLAAADLPGARLFYAADEDDTLDAENAALAHAAGVLVNIVDNLHDSEFITPAIVDRDPVTVAIGTEGAAPVLARAIKADLEERLPVTLGPLALSAKAFASWPMPCPWAARAVISGGSIISPPAPAPWLRARIPCARR